MRIFIKGLLLSLIRDYFRDLESFIQKEYFSSISQRIRKKIDSSLEVNKLQEEINLLEKECSDLEFDVLKKKQFIEETHKMHENKLKVFI